MQRPAADARGGDRERDDDDDRGIRDVEITGWTRGAIERARREEIAAVLRAIAARRRRLLRGIEERRP